MRKKASGKIAALLFMGGFLLFTGVVLYNYFKPKEATLYNKDVIEMSNAKLTYANAESHILKDEEVHYLWVCRMDNADCTYVQSALSIRHTQR